MDKSLNLIEEARLALQIGERVHSHELTNISKDISVALNQCVNCLPGQRDVDEVICNIDDTAQILTMNEFPHSTKSYGYVSVLISDLVEVRKYTETIFVCICYQRAAARIEYGCCEFK